MYNEGVLIYMTIYTSLTEIGWVINEEGEDASLHAIRFGAMVLNEQQQGYAQVKRELLGIVSIVKADKDYFICRGRICASSQCLQPLKRLEVA